MSSHKNNNKNTRVQNDRVHENDRYDKKVTDFNEHKQRPQRPSELILIENAFSEEKQKNDN